MDKHIELINAAFSDTVKSFSKIQLSTHSLQTLNEGKRVIHDGTMLLSTLQQYTAAIESILKECNAYVQEIQDDLSAKKPREDYVYATAHGMVSYGGRDFIRALMQDTPKSPPVEPSPTADAILWKKHSLEEIGGYEMEFPTVKRFSDITPMFYYYDNPDDTVHTPGIYCSIIKDVIIKVPFPTIIDSTRDYSRGKSIKCKYDTRILCDENRTSMAKRHKSDMRKCNFAHTGDRITKIGYPSRCSVMPRFGNASTLVEDMSVVKLSDIKNILLYGLNDVIVASIWFYHHRQKPGIYSRVDVA